jgi:hypothetical protein
MVGGQELNVSCCSSVTPGLRNLKLSRITHHARRKMNLDPTNKQNEEVDNHGPL